MSQEPENTAPVIEILPSVAPLAARSDAWIVDIWGVIHNGIRPYRDACDACLRFREKGGAVVLLTNAPRPWTGVRDQLHDMGVDREIYDGIATSGDVTRGMIEANAGRPLYHLGPERDRPIFEGLDVNFAAAADAEIIALTGLFDDDVETPADYADMLARFRARNVPMICANPDLKVEKGDSVIYCAGALAEAYAAIGGEVELAGKPYPPIYEMAIDLIARTRGAPVDKARILCIGDGIHTDIKGAATMGLDALFIPSRVHMTSSQSVSEADLAAAFEDLPFRPVAAQNGLKW